MADKVFAIAADPLTLGTTFECFKISAQVGGQWKEIYTKTGGFLQRDSRVNVKTIRADYYVESGGTAPARGSTCGGYVVDDTSMDEGSETHKTLSVTATVRQNVTLTDTLVQA